MMDLISVDGCESMVEQSILTIEPHTKSMVNFGLPPSKSHLIRWLLLAAQSEKTVRINNVEGAARDAISMRDALLDLGVRIDVLNSTWVVHGTGVNGFKAPGKMLNFHNSGTALRLLSMAVTRMEEPITIHGDDTLSPRISRDFWQALGIDVSFASDHENLPMVLKGPVCVNSLKLDGRKTSQHLSAILLSMPALENPIELTIEGDIVSRRHAELTFSLAAKCGSTNTFENRIIKPWTCQPPSEVNIPLDASHVAFWKLYEVLHTTSIEYPTVSQGDSIGAELLQDIDLNHRLNVDLSDANDLITPLAAAMAIGGGGRITGAGHARFKESNRIEQTVQMLAAFSLEIEATEDGLRMAGGQMPLAPNSVIETFGDHRMQMTAVVLATRVGAEIRGRDLHQVSFPDFLNYIQP